MSRPLLNPMTTTKPITPATPPKKVGNRSQPEDLTLLHTPHSSVQMRHAFSVISPALSYDRSIRLFLAKVGRGLDNQNTKIISLDRDIYLLNHQIEEMKPKKRKKITPNPNAKFVKVEDVYKARQKMYAHLDPPGTSNRVSKLKFCDMCFEWQLMLPNGEEMVNFGL
jgi:hypothetical protein